ncbi:acyl-CoA N-acyltransferase [Elsinoe ampelina]|uniref:Acyl-CoA N-acyltransferase n=1 Tax=Elsinoe ampelina TaxID=302913 RepID=A0A6A6GIH0_9PEZI|nr:acyl-CoA N-acyltransferase [Elsinoe ampelina]
MSSSGPTFTIHPATTPTHITQARTLIEAYANWLDLDLTFQSFSTELSSLPGCYAPPSGRLLLALTPSDEAIGVIGLRCLPSSKSGKEAELKRLYVLPSARGSGAGRALVEAAIEAATEERYERLRLDTLGHMTGAIGLYKSFGFKAVDAYYKTPLEGTVFLDLDLREPRHQAQGRQVNMSD